jgi:transposase
MSKPVARVQIITGIHRRRRYTAEEKVRLVELNRPGFAGGCFA